MSKVAAKTQITLSLTTKEVANSVKTYNLSKHFTEKMLRISVLNIMYHRISIEESEFEKKKYEKIPYVIMKRKSTNRLIRKFHGISQGIVDAVNKEYLKEVWVFIKEKGSVDMENYLFRMKYNSDVSSKSDVKPAEIREQTAELFDALANIPNEDKYHPELVDFIVEFKFIDGVPSDYEAPHFEDAPSPYCLSVDEKSSVLLGITNTGYHKLKCIGAGKLFSTSRCSTPALVASAVQKEPEEGGTQDTEMHELSAPASEILIEAEKSGRFSNPPSEAGDSNAEPAGNQNKKQKLDESEFCGFQETISIASRSELITCSCEWELPSDYETIKCSKCECFVHAVCHGYWTKKMADPATFECYACAGGNPDEFVPKMRVVLFYIKEKKKLPAIIMKNATKFVREKIMTTLMKSQVLKGHAEGNNKSAINGAALNQIITSMFRTAESQFFE